MLRNVVADTFFIESHVEFQLHRYIFYRHDTEAGLQQLLEDCRCTISPSICAATRAFAHGFFLAHSSATWWKIFRSCRIALRLLEDGIPFSRGSMYRGNSQLIFIRYVIVFTRSPIAGPILSFLLFESIWCLNEVAKELENPFGQDTNDARRVPPSRSLKFVSDVGSRVFLMYIIEVLIV